jgi:hypothetical protein
MTYPGGDLVAIGLPFPVAGHNGLPLPGEMGLWIRGVPK